MVSVAGGCRGVQSWGVSVVVAKIDRTATGYSVRLSLTDPLTGRRLQKRISARTRRLLDAEVARVRAEWNSGAYIEPDKTTLSQWMETWHATYKAGSASRYKRLRIIRQRIQADDIGRIPLTRLRYAQVQDWIDRMVLEGLAPNTIRTIESTLSMALAQAVRRQIIASNPCTGLELPSSSQRRWCVLDEVQARRIVTDTRDDPLHACWVLAVTLGVRRGELVALTWTDVDFTAGTLRIERTMTVDQRGRKRVGDETKTDASRRTIRLPAVCVDALRWHRARQNERRLAAGDAWTDTGVVFDGGLGERFPYNRFTAAFRDLKAELGLPDEMRIHDLRHSAASLMIHAGVPIPAIAKVLGHANPSITLRVYSHALKAMEDQATVRIDALFSANRDRIVTSTGN